MCAMTHGVTPLSLDAMPLFFTRALMRQEGHETG